MPKDNPVGVSFSGSVMPLALIVSIILASIGGVFWLSQLEADVEVNCTWIQEAKPVMIQIPVILRELEIVNKNLTEIKGDIKTLRRD